MSVLSPDAIVVDAMAHAPVLMDGFVEAICRCDALKRARPMGAEAERVKLTAAFLNNTAVGVALAGFIKPLVDAADASLTRYAWLLAAATLHPLARWSLGALADDPDD